MEDRKSGASSSAQAASAISMTTLLAALQAEATQQLPKLPSYGGLSRQKSNRILTQMYLYLTAHNTPEDQQSTMVAECLRDEVRK